MTWDGATGTVTAVKPDVSYTAFQGNTKQGDLTVKLTIGSNDITYWYERKYHGRPPMGIRPRLWSTSRVKWPLCLPEPHLYSLRPAGRCAELQCRLGRRGGSGHHR